MQMQPGQPYPIMMAAPNMPYWGPVYPGSQLPNIQMSHQQPQMVQYPVQEPQMVPYPQMVQEGYVQGYVQQMQ